MKSLFLFLVSLLSVTDVLCDTIDVVFVRGHISETSMSMLIRDASKVNKGNMMCVYDAAHKTELSIFDDSFAAKTQYYFLDDVLVFYAIQFYQIGQSKKKILFKYLLYSYGKPDLEYSDGSVQWNMEDGIVFAEKDANGFDVVLTFFPRQPVFQVAKKKTR